MIEGLMQREYLKDRVLGTLTFFNDNVEIGRFYTLERPWLDNARSKSCIPTGTYEVELNNTKAHPNTFRVLDVKDRSGILMHIGNYPKHSEGCILVGLVKTDLDNDGVMDITNSTLAIEKMNQLINKNFKLIIC